MLQPKDTYWLNESKNKTPIKLSTKVTLDVETHINWKRGWKKIFHANGNQKKVGVAILTSDKIDFKIKTVIRDKEGYYIMIRGWIQEDITIINIKNFINIYAPNIGASHYIRQILITIKGETV